MGAVRRRPCCRMTSRPTLRVIRPNLIALRLTTRHLVLAPGRLPPDTWSRITRAWPTSLRIITDLRSLQCTTLDTRLLKFFIKFLGGVLFAKELQKSYLRVRNTVHGGIATPVKNGGMGVRWGQKVLDSGDFYPEKPQSNPDQNGGYAQ